VWTDDGLPILDVVKALVSNDSLTRDDINKVALGLTKATVATYTKAPNKRGKETVAEIIEVVVLPQEAVVSELQTLESELAANRLVSDASAVALSELQAKINTLQAQVVKPTPNEEFNSAIANHMAGAAKERLERAEKLAAFDKLGLTEADIKELFPHLNRR
jgi:hypothetical protein